MEIMKDLIQMGSFVIALAIINTPECSIVLATYAG